MPPGKIIRLKAHALFITVVLSLVIGIFCSMLLLLGYHRMRIDAVVGRDARLRRDLRSAIDMVLADSAIILASQEDTLDLYGEGRDTVIVGKSNWGLFSIARVSAVRGGKSSARLFFFGQAADTPLDGCLWLAEHQTPLSLVGYARLKGDAHIPKGGLRPAYIDQRGFAFPQLIIGNTNNSGDSLPPIDPRLLALLSPLAAYPPSAKVSSSPIDASPSPVERSLVPDSLERSFADTAITVHRKDPILLSSCNLNGHIIIASDSMIRVSPGAVLENVILSAPVIRLDSGWSGSLQAIASDSIIIQNNCHLKYPSALVLLKIRGLTTQPRIILGDGCILDGVILTHTSLQKDMEQTYVEIGKNSLLNGWVYAAGFVFLKGEVHGAVMADHFLFKSLPTVYVNYLVDAGIDRSALSPWFTGPHIFNNDRQSRIVQWVR
ncbi:MAG TPA: hypothetical protein VNW04_23585 [Puia sp.]|jgi:hypothetical protein|nr:hypothetical protein [Puia sp.]